MQVVLVLICKFVGTSASLRVDSRCIMGIVVDVVNQNVDFVLFRLNKSLHWGKK